jgi:hypothetical protein
MIAPSSGAATLVQPPSAAGVPKSGDLVMSMLDYDEGGHVTVTGKATPGAMVRAYINDKMVAEGKAAADGSCRLVPAKPVGPGKYTLRLDRLAKDGCRAWRQSLEHCAHTLRQRLPPQPDPWRQQGPDPRPGSDLPWPSLQLAQGQLKGASFAVLLLGDTARPSSQIPGLLWRCSRLSRRVWRSARAPDGDAGVFYRARIEGGSRSLLRLRTIYSSTVFIALTFLAQSVSIPIARSNSRLRCRHLPSWRPAPCRP